MCSELVEFRNKRTDWLFWLNGRKGGAAQNEQHCIESQLNSLVYDAAVYRAINKARFTHLKDDAGRLALNRLLHEFIDRCYFQKQSLAIRRLLDKAGNKQEHAADGERGVYSLVGLLEDIGKHAQLWSRNNIIAAEGLYHDCQSAESESRQIVQRQINDGIALDDIQHPNLYPLEMSKTRHVDLDRWFGTVNNASNSQDVFKRNLKQLEEKIKEDTKDIKKIADKYIAHAATVESRQFSPETIDREKYEQAIKTLVQVATVISDKLFGKGQVGHLFPIKRDGFGRWDEPLVRSEQIHLVAESWQDFDRTLAAWRDNASQLILPSTD